MSSFTENNLIITGLAPNADYLAGTVNTDIVDMRNHRTCNFIVHEGTGTTGTSVLTIESSDDISASNTTAVAFRYRIGTAVGVWGAWVTAAAAGFTTTAGGDQLIAIEVKSNELADGEPYVRLHGVEGVDAATDGGITIILSDPRYPQNVPATATD